MRKQTFHSHEEFIAFIIEEAKESGHEWELDDDGNIELFAYSCGIHNGPVCKKCGYHYCIHCSSPENCKGDFRATARHDAERKSEELANNGI